MKKNKPILLIVIGIITVILIILLFFANSFVKNKIEALLQNNIPDHIENSYESISVNVLGGTVSLNELSLQIKLKDSSLIQTKAIMKSFTIAGVSYWDYIFNDEIHVGSIKFEDLQLEYYKDHKNKPKDSIEGEKPIELPKPIIIDNINFENTAVSIFDKSKDSTFLYSKNINVAIEDILLNESTLLQKIPIKYGDVSIQTDSIFFKTGIYEDLFVNHLEIENNNITLKDIHFKTKYSKTELSKIITKERDHLNIKVDEFKINNLDFGFENDSLFVKSNLISINKTDAAFYRDKLVADDYKLKNLYSKSLRELPIKLTIDSVSIVNSKVEYSEKGHPENPAGVLTISNLNGGVSNLSNTYSSPEKTTIYVEAIFMKNSPMDATWSFDINQINDAFTFVGHLGKLEASDMNVFIAPLINVKLEGEIIETYFDITGDYNQSVINISQDYDNIKVDIFNKKKKKRKALSEIANVFINDDSEVDGQIFHNVTANASRDKTKSFFNYLARNLKSSLLIMFTKRNKSDKKKSKKHKGKKRN